MNIKHILKRCIDNLYSKGASSLLWAVLDEDHALICFDGKVIYRLPNEDLKVSFHRVRSRTVLNVWKDLEEKNEAGDYHTALLRYDVDAPEAAKPIRKLTVFNEQVYINAALLKGFDKNAEIRITDPVKPVLVFEDGEMVGAVFPVNMRQYGGGQA